jgi:Protein of unknown function (DUF1622)
MITAPLTFESVGLLAAIVGIRTFLSFSLETEIEGCWPWQRATKQGESRGAWHPVANGKKTAGGQVAATITASTADMTSSFVSPRNITTGF